MNHPAPISATEIAAMADHPDFVVATKCATQLFEMLKEKLPKAAPFLDLNRLTGDLCEWTEAMRQAGSPEGVQTKTYSRILDMYIDESVARMKEAQATEAEGQVRAAVANLRAALAGDYEDGYEGTARPRWVWEAAALRMGLLKAH